MKKSLISYQPCAYKMSNVHMCIIFIKQLFNKPCTFLHLSELLSHRGAVEQSI